MPDNILVINYFGGSYGNFVDKFLKLHFSKNTVEYTRNNFHYPASSSFISIDLCHDNEKDSDTKNLKITYKPQHINIISRNVWNKEPQHLTDKTQREFENYPDNVDIDTKKIVVMAFYKSKLLNGLDNWNTILKRDTIELPLDYFFSTPQRWLIAWRKIFDELKIVVDDEYILSGHYIFNKTQESLLNQHNFYSDLGLRWRDQDIIGRGNILGEIFYKEHDRYQVPIDLNKYTDTRHMMVEWIKKLDNGDVDYKSKL